MLKSLRPRPSQHGLVLIEALVSILIFSIGILGLIGMQANAIAFSTDAKFRADAAIMANQILAQISVSDAGQLSSFAHQTGGTVCSPTGTASSNASVLDWIDEVNEAFAGASPQQQIIVNTLNGTVTVGICWQVSGSTPHNYTVINQIQWQS
jgi:type IV pilus assembly protein PilV